MEINLNFDGKDSGEIYGIPPDRVEYVAEKMAAAAVDITRNIERYKWEEADGSSGLHKGKCIERFLQEITDHQERLMALSASDELLCNILRKLPIIEHLFKSAAR